MTNPKEVLSEFLCLVDYHEKVSQKKWAGRRDVNEERVVYWKPRGGEIVPSTTGSIERGTKTSVRLITLLQQYFIPFSMYQLDKDSDLYRKYSVREEGQTSG